MQFFQFFLTPRNIPKKYRRSYCQPGLLIHPERFMEYLIFASLILGWQPPTIGTCQSNMSSFYLKRIITKKKWFQCAGNSFLFLRQNKTF